MRVANLQAGIARAGLDGWLFFDHHGRDPLSYRILGINSDQQTTRRWYYYVPADGEPAKLVHRIESRTLDGLPGAKLLYASWAEQIVRLRELLDGAGRIAMQYSRDCAIPYISLVDAGTVELIRGLGIDVVSSGDLVQEFEARWTEEQLASHLEAGRRVDRIRRAAFDLIGERTRAQASVSEYEIQQFILQSFAESGLTTDHGPIVAADDHASDPHFEPNRENSRRIETGDFVLIDMWAKLANHNAVYYDITWSGFCGNEIPSRIQNVFEIVRDARKKACDFVKSAAESGARIAGFRVDDIARDYITRRGYGEAFFHRTGHSIGTEVHGAGANMDNLECHDERLILPNTCFSIEPGIYLNDFGIRSEVDVYVGDHDARVTGEEQDCLVRI